jgi:hypothetical protein
MTPKMQVAWPLRDALRTAQAVLDQKIGMRTVTADRKRRLEQVDDAVRHSQRESVNEL